MENISFTKILKDALVGKKLKVKTFGRNIIVPCTVWIKNSARSSTRVIGYHDKYEIFTISDVWIEKGNGGDILHLICKDGGREFTVDFTDELEAIGDNIYMIKHD